jgi:uncharacterized membrane protein
MKKALILLLLLLLMPIGRATDEWWNSTWHYRIKIEVNSTGYDRLDWPVEIEMNITKILEQNGFSGQLDLNSTRLFEYGSDGKILYEVPSQFDPKDDFNASSNAIGTLAFIMNGTTPAYQKRTYYLYFDTIENGQKSEPSYSSDLSYYWNGQRLNVNTSLMAYYLDTNMSENTSGLYSVYGLTAGQYIFNVLSGKTAEYSQYSNSTHTFNFNLRDNSTIKHIGPARIVFEQRGNETVWNSSTITEGYLIKRYIFYSSNKWIKVEQEYINLANTSITRNSTPAGALGLEYERVFGSNYVHGTTTNGVVWAGYPGVVTAFIQLNNSYQNYFPVDDVQTKKVGIQLNSTAIGAGQRIKQYTVLYFNETDTDFVGASELADKLYTPENISLSNGESFGVVINAITDFDFYNLGEIMLIQGNNTKDPYNLTKAMNATLDLGTSDMGDDETIVLYNDGTHNDTVANDSYYTNTFYINPSYQHGLWNITVKAYSIDNVLLNQSVKMITVTNIYNVSVNITTPVVFNGYPVNALIYVKNFRQDTWISSANISCYVNNQPIPNSTVDYGNGTYFITFNAPMEAGYYSLNCSAMKNNNTGFGLGTFLVEDLRTRMTILVQPNNYTATNITWFINESFAFNANATNVANGTAYDANFTLQLPSGWMSNATIDACGNIGFGQTCFKDFLVTIKNGTPPGNYLVNVTIEWRNPDNSTDSNTTSINVTVLPNIIINVPESEISAIAPAGREKTIGNFTVESLGNEKLLGVNFTVIGLDDFYFEFEPSNFSSIEAGGTRIVKVNITVPDGYMPGNYTGKINITTDNDGFDEINLSINVPGTNMTVDTSIANYTAYNITSERDEKFNFSVNATNIGNNMAFDVNITLELPQNWTVNVSSYSCGNVDINNSCFTDFEVTIPNRTRSGVYLLNVSSVWLEPEIGVKQNKTTINVNVTSNVTMYIAEDSLNTTAPHGNTSYLGNFTIHSLGNDPVENITYNFYNLNDFIFTYDPNTTILYSGFSSTIHVNVSIPYGYAPGNYTGFLIVNSTGGYKNISINIQVPPDMTWNMTPTVCEHLEFPEEGVACEVMINNTGNLAIAFNITPSSANYTRVNETNFTVQPASVHVFSVLYNVTGISKGYYNSTYIVDALNASANPDKELLKVFLSPLIYPIVSVFITPSVIHQGGNLSIYANITDQSGRGINYVTAFVTSPKGVEYRQNMTRIWNSSENSTWFVAYPSNWGSTMPRGNYSVLIRAVDNAGNQGNASSYFIVYPNMSITLDTGDHYQGQTATYYIRVHDVYGDPLPFSNVSVVMINANNNVTFNRSQVTNEYGEVLEEERQFTLASDAPTGLYVIYANGSWYDSLSNRKINGSGQTSFNVYQNLGTGLFVDVSTVVVWYPNNVMKFSIIVYNDRGLAIDPDELNLTVYDPADNRYFAVTIGDLTRRDAGFYTYNFAMPLNTSTGAYRAVVDAKKGSYITRDIHPFRVASGGPYDVRINLIDTEVPVGDYLDFDLVIENKGENSQDVDVEYWVSDGSGNVWYYNSEALYTPSFSNQTFPRKAFIFTNQPIGMYWLNVKVTYDLVQPPIRKNVTFLVIPAVPTTTLPPGPPGAPPPAPPAVPPAPPVVEKEVNKISIIEYPMDIGIESGWARYPTVKVKNTGNTVLHNIKLIITGLPKAWLLIEPGVIESLRPNEVAVFSLRITVPSGEKTKEYPFKIIALSNETSDEKTGMLFVFSSREELLRYELEKVKKEYQDVLNKTDQAEKEGKDVSAVRTLLNEAKRNIDEAEEMINRKDYDNALEKIMAASNLISRAREMLPKMPKAKPMVLPGLPLSTFIIMLIALILAMTIIVFMFKKKIIDFSKLFKREKTEAEMIAEAIKKESPEKQALLEEKEKINKVIALLDAEAREGIISKEAYEELKKRNLEKLEEIERKLEKMK